MNARFYVRTAYTYGSDSLQRAYPGYVLELPVCVPVADRYGHHFPAGRPDPPLGRRHGGWVGRSTETTELH